MQPVVTCPHCMTKNRYSADIPVKQVRCSACKRPIDVGDSPGQPSHPKPPPHVVHLPAPPVATVAESFHLPSLNADTAPAPEPTVPALKQPTRGGPLASLLAALAWGAVLAALPVGLRTGRPVFAVVLASAGLALGALSLGFAASRRRWGAWGAASLTAVLAAVSALVAATSVPGQQTKHDDLTPREAEPT